MRAIVCPRYGPPDVLQLNEVDKPVPGDDELLIRIHATTVTAADCRVRALNFPTGFGLLGRLGMGVVRPRKAILGTDLSGEVEAVGSNVERFEEGDQVFAVTGADFGAYADYICLSEDGVVASKPPNLTHEEAAAVPFGALTALYFLRERGHVQGGQKVLVYGASGAVGTAAVQIAKHLGANVTGVCSTANLDLVKSLGADRVIDYTREDFAVGDEQYDVILETVGKAPVSRCRDALKPEGRCILVAGGVPHFVLMLWTSIIGRKRVICGVTPERTADLLFVKELVEAGEHRPVIDRRYPLEGIVEAHRYADTGHKRGNVVITLVPNSSEREGALQG